MKNISILLLAIALQGCMAIGKDFSYVQDVPQDKALVYVYHPWSSEFSMNDATFLYVNHVSQLLMRRAGYTYFLAEPGEHLFYRRLSSMYVPTVRKGDTVFNFEAGKTYYIRYSEIEDKDDVRAHSLDVSTAAVTKPVFELARGEDVELELPYTKYQTPKTIVITPLDV